MAEIKLSKGELRTQQNHLSTLQKYLPTLQLKKAMLQTEIGEARQELHLCRLEYSRERSAFEEESALLSENTPADPFSLTQIKEINKNYENIAGIEIPYFNSISFNEVEYSLFDSPPWFEAMVLSIRNLIIASVRIDIANEKKNLLETELRQVSIKVNLFEKILIPRALSNIKKIKVFLGDQQLAAVSQAKVAKAKIEKLKALHRLHLNAGGRYAG